MCRFGIDRWYWNDGIIWLILVVFFLNIYNYRIFIMIFFFINFRCYWLVVWVVWNVVIDIKLDNICLDNFFGWGKYKKKICWEYL